MNILDFNKKLKTGEVSVRETALSYFDAIKNKNQKLNAYLETFSASGREGKEYDALLEAQKIDERIKNGEEPGILWGVPMAIKDNILISGEKTTAASKILENHVASYSASVINKLHRAGAILLGHTNMDEFAMGSSTENSAFGPTHHPLRPDYVPGGSSGGSAVAVAAHMSMAALGSDTGGSIRQPASFCGVVGLKPTYGAVSRSGLIAMASSFDQIGPIAQTVDDAEIIFNAICGQDSWDSTSADNKIYSQKDLSQTKQVKTIGVPKEYFSEGLDPRIKNVIETMIKRLSKAYEIREIELPHTKYAIACYYIIVTAEVSSNMARFDGIRYGVREKGENILEVYKKSRGKGIGREVRRRILLGTYVLSHGYYDAYYSRAQKIRTLIKDDFMKAFNDVDVIIGPTSPTLPFKIGEKSNDPLAMYLSDIYTIPVNLAGVPAISVPSGNISENGVDFSVGLQLIAPHFAENRLFEVGKAIEKLNV